MKLNIAGRIFNSEEVKELTIREAQREVFVSTENNFFRIKYRSAEEIADVYFFKQLDSITTKEVDQAIYLLSMICEVFINSKAQCNNCPLKVNSQCLLTTIPINWR